MKRKSYRKYLLIGLALFFLITFPTVVVERLRGLTIGVLSKFLKNFSLEAESKQVELDRLEGENHLLRIEIGKLKALLDQQFKTMALQQEQNAYPINSLRYEQTGFLLGNQAQAVAARVIYRDPGSWSSSLWVNVGEATNTILERVVIAKNSPVIVGRAVVGVIDYVGKHQSRIRLVTDMALKPSVRAVRGHLQNGYLIEHIELIQRQLEQNTLSITAQDKKRLLFDLEQIKVRLFEGQETHYLAKGILQGSGTPLWRSANQTLRGIGFNYDFADQEGDARELTSTHDGGALPLIKEHDLLLTTGLDGVFPPGLRVAEVQKIFPLFEGAYTYEIEALPVVRNLDTLQTVFIIPPIGFEYENCDGTRDRSSRAVGLCGRGF